MIYELTVQQRRNRHSDVRDNGQITVLNFTYYVQTLRFFVFQTDGQKEILIRGGLGNLIGSSR